MDRADRDPQRLPLVPRAGDCKPGSQCSATIPRDRRWGGRGHARADLAPAGDAWDAGRGGGGTRAGIRLHTNELKYCYEQELVKNSALSGRLSIQFVIAATGQVTNSVSQSSTLNNVRVENCVAQAFRRWEFPKPSGGGITIVSYPFSFIPGGWDRVAQVAAVPEAPRPPSPWDVSLTALQGKGDKGELKARIAKVAGILAVPATESPSVLAWWIVERYLRSGGPVPGACILAANLLREANRPHEAGRILSEAGGVDGVAVTAEFRRWSSGPDVARLTELAARQ